MKITRRGGEFDFVDTGRPNPISKEDAKKIDDAYARSSGYKDYNDYLEHKDDPLSLFSLVMIVGFVILIIGIVFLVVSFLWNIIVPIIGG